MASNELSDRKRALYLIKRTTSLNEKIWMTKCPIPWNSKQWKTYFLLWDTIEEAETHLLKVC
jgi:hypothetical protein